jgi:hypothetical protein
MLAASVPARVEDASPGAVEGAEAIFVGNLLPLMVGLGYTSTEQFHSRKHELVAMGCVRQLRRGVRWRPGAWILYRAPTPELWLAHVARPFSYRREAAVREQHHRLLAGFFRDVASSHPGLLAELVDVGAHTAAEVIAYLAGLPETRLRALFPGGQLCLGYAVQGAGHICHVADLDPLAPSTSAGAWKRRADHLEDLRKSG